MVGNSPRQKPDRSTFDSCRFQVFDWYKEDKMDKTNIEQLRDALKKIREGAQETRAAVDELTALLKKLLGDKA
jgi:asparagine synthetase A